MTEDSVYVIGHRHPDTDSIVLAIAYAHLKNVLGFTSVRPARAGEINSETRYVLERFSLHEPELLTDAAGRHVILVDHNEIAQALPGIQNATIQEVWEHHRIGDLDIARPIMFHCEPVGAAATLIAEQYFFHHIVPSPAIAAGLLAAILSDTLIFSSPTCSEKDRRIGQQLATIAKLDATALGQDLIAARGDVATRPVSQLVEEDFKEFSLAGNHVGIGQVETVDVDPILTRRQEFFNELRRVREKKGLLQVILLVTDITKKGSYVWFVGDRRDLLEQALGGKLIDGVMYVPGCMSRKKQVVPPLEEAFATASAGPK